MGTGLPGPVSPSHFLLTALSVLPMCWACCYWIQFSTWFWPGELLMIQFVWYQRRFDKRVSLDLVMSLSIHVNSIGKFTVRSHDIR